MHFLISVYFSNNQSWPGLIVVNSQIFSVSPGMLEKQQEKRDFTAKDNKNKRLNMFQALTCVA